MAKSELFTEEGKRYCAYRGEQGRRCAAGIFISDENYSGKMEGQIAFTDAVKSGLLASGFPDKYEHRHLLLELQKVHDGWAPASWKVALNDIAKEYKFDSKVLEEFP
jgi:hypothetical protein